MRAWLPAATVCMVAAGAAWAGPESLPGYEIVGKGIPAPLTGRPGDAAAGRAVFLDRERGHCLLCHRVATIDAPFPGTLGPDLTDVGAKLGPDRLRLRLVDSTRLNPDTVMPAYYRTDDLVQVARDHAGKPVLSAQEIEDLVAYLSTLRGDAK
jgi:sulfur-oxidizing protein SoxX